MVIAFFVGLLAISSQCPGNPDALCGPGDLLDAGISAYLGGGGGNCNNGCDE